MMMGVMVRQQMSAEIIGRIAPDGVDVVGVILGVVVFADEARALNAVVVPLPFFETASPGKVDSVEAVFAEVMPLCLGEFVRHSMDIFADESQQDLLLLAVHTVAAEAAGGIGIAQRLDMGIVHAMGLLPYLQVGGVGRHFECAFNCLGEIVEYIIGRRSRRDSRDGEGLLVKGAGQLPGQVFDACQRSEGGRRAEGRIGRVRAEEHRRGRDDFSIRDREIERDMMPFESPSPQALFIRAIENGHEIELWIAAGMCSLPVFQHVEGVFNAHHGGGGNKTGATEASMYQLEGFLPLREGHFGEGKTLA